MNGWHRLQNEAPRWTVELLHTIHEAHVARITTLRSLDGLSQRGWLGLICMENCHACWQQIAHFSANSQRQLLNPAMHFPCSYWPQFDKFTAIRTHNLTQMLTIFVRSFFPPVKRHFLLSQYLLLVLVFALIPHRPCPFISWPSSASRHLSSVGGVLRTSSNVLRLVLDVNHHESPNTPHTSGKIVDILGRWISMDSTKKPAEGVTGSQEMNWKHQRVQQMDCMDSGGCGGLRISRPTTHLERHKIPNIWNMSLQNHTTSVFST